MTWFYRAFSTSIGKKQLMAVTGLALTLFLAVHLAGNLLIFLGPEAFNGYARALEESPLLIPAEIGLFLVFAVHVLLAATVTVQNREARPVRYARKKREGGKTVASSTMLLSGSFILVFIVIHLINFKFAAREGTTLYHLVLDKFQSLPYVYGYIAAMFVLGVHIGHGFQSAFRTLGLVHPKYTPLVTWAGKALMVAFFVGYSSIPAWAYAFARPAP
jgi:succinate dehydrogenase / fumarate reductase cytochrome b subunit